MRKFLEKDHKIIAIFSLITLLTFITLFATSIEIPLKIAISIFYMCYAAFRIEGLVRSFFLYILSILFILGVNSVLAVHILETKTIDVTTFMLPGSLFIFFTVSLLFDKYNITKFKLLKNIIPTFVLTGLSALYALVFNVNNLIFYILTMLAIVFVVFVILQILKIKGKLIENEK